MILVALSLAAASANRPSDLQIMIGPAFQQFARMSERICPARRLRFITPADLDYKEEGFVGRLPRDVRGQVDAANDHGRSCANPNAGLSCPAQHMLDALSKAHQLGAFTRFACSSPGQAPFSVRRGG